MPKLGQGLDGAKTGPTLLLTRSFFGADDRTEFLFVENFNLKSNLSECGTSGRPFATTNAKARVRGRVRNVITIYRSEKSSFFSFPLKNWDSRP